MRAPLWRRPMDRTSATPRTPPGLCVYASRRTATPRDMGVASLIPRMTPRTAPRAVREKGLARTSSPDLESPLLPASLDGVPLPGRKPDGIQRLDRRTHSHAAGLPEAPRCPPLFRG